MPGGRASSGGAPDIDNEIGGRETIGSSRMFSISGLLALAVTAAGGGPQSAQAADLKPFRIGISAPMVTIFPVWMGEAGGFYEKEGLKVEVVLMEGGAAGAGADVPARSRRCMSVLRRWCWPTAGADLRLVTSTGNTIPIPIFGTPAIESMADLKGKTVGISTFGSETDIAISIALRNAGRVARMSPSGRSAAARGDSAR